MSIGESLKRARKRQNLELDDAARATKISKMFLIALEADDYSSLPGGVYTSNFLRAYSKYLGLDDDLIISEYHEQYQVKPTFLLHYEQTKKDDVQFKRDRRKYFLLFGSVSVAALGLVSLFIWPGFLLKKINRSIPEGPMSTAQKEQSELKPSGQVTQTTEDVAIVKSEDSPVVGAAEAKDPEATEAVPSQENDSSLKNVSSLNAPLETTVTPDSSIAESKNISTTLVDVENSNHNPMTTTLSFPIREIGNTEMVIGSPASLNDVLGVKALADVRLRVMIDGVLATDRRLRKGQVRYYGLGQINSISCDDGSKLAVQQGERVLDHFGEPGQVVSVEHFGPGQFFQVLAEYRASLLNAKQ